MSDTVQCPECGATERDLDDHDWGTSEEIVTACNSCGEDYVLCRRVSVTYSACSVASTRPCPECGHAMGLHVVGHGCAGTVYEGGRVCGICVG